ncbi:MAG TPA: calcium-binding protein [Xanthobacteraceae bacterium]|nr:calcium-binding protein [Xanthobacteraceae bacterium]
MTFSLADATHAKGAIENLTLMGSASIDGTGNGFDNIITGNAAANTLMGMGGNDTLDGGNGADHMLGGAGDDTYVVDNSGDVADETGGDGTDLVQSSITFSLADGAHVIGAVESLTLTGSAAIDGTGNNLNNVITGNAAANVLTGLDGDDTLDGGKGADRLFGGLGNDSYIVDNKKDVADETGGDGTDTVFSAVAFSLSNANQALGAIENLTLTGSGGIKGTGNALDNIIAGNSGKNTLAGQGGADTFVFTSGFGKDTIKDFGAGSAAGHDFVQFSTSVFADFAAVLSHAADTKHDVVITFDANDTLTLHSVHKADLVSGDFLFV